MMMEHKILVAYFTKGGASEEYAKIIAGALYEEGLSVETYNLANEIPELSEFETIILGTGVRMFHVYGRWKKILKQKELPGKKLYMFLSSGMAIEEPDKAVTKFLQPLVEKYDLKPESLVSFPGKIPEKWAKYDEKKDTMKPDIAKKWAEEISLKVKSK